MKVLKISHGVTGWLVNIIDILSFSFKRQTAIDWSHPVNSSFKLRKSKSLPNSGTPELIEEKFVNALNEDDSKPDKNTKKKKKNKMTKKAKAVSNAKIFLQKKS